MSAAKEKRRGQQLAHAFFVELINRQAGRSSLI
jgi:hypothetical protein